MKNKILGALGLFVLPVLLLAGVAGAQSFRSGDNVTVPADEVVSSTLFAAGQTIDIAGDVNGDVFCAGQTVVISGTVTGDVICAGQTVKVSGRIQGDARLAGQSVTVGSQVTQSISAAAQSFVLEAGASVGRDVSIATEDAVFNGSVRRDLALAATNATVANNVGRDINAAVTDLNLSERARVGGDLDYTSENRADIADGAQIAGRTNRTDREAPNRGQWGTDASVFALSFGFGVYMLISLLLISLALVLLFPRALSEAARWALNSPGKTILIGFLAGLLVPIFIVALMTTFIGIPLALVLLLAWLLILALSGPFASYYAGRLVFKGNAKSPIVTMLVGSLAIIVLYFIPILNVITAVLVVWMGTGMILSELFFRTPKPEYGADASKNRVKAEPEAAPAAKKTTRRKKTAKKK